MTVNSGIAGVNVTWAAHSSVTPHHPMLNDYLQFATTASYVCCFIDMLLPKIQKYYDRMTKSILARVTHV